MDADLRAAAQVILDRCLDFFEDDDLDPDSSEAMPVVIKNRWVYDLRAALAAPAVTEPDLLDVKWWATKLGERNGSNRYMAEFVVATLASRLAPAVTECNVEGFHDHRFDGPHRLARQTRCIREEASDGR